MKPLKLVLSAFGSYGGCECVDFEKMQKGLFLITGDTGAGKTTIFDGISYALYGQTSGRRRDGDMMRSQYATDADETFVEFTFIESGKIYKIRRNPNWQRMSKRKNKAGEYALTKVSAKVELTMPDGTVFAGKMKETDQKIIEIIGMDIHQFCQVSMISQGDFMKLLFASSKERKEIFSKIFPTEVYWRIQIQLKDQERYLYGQLENMHQRCQSDISNVQYLSESAYKSAWEENGHFSEIDNEDVLKLIESIISETTAKEKELQDVIKNIDVLIELYRIKDEKLEREKKLKVEVECLEDTILKLFSNVDLEEKELLNIREHYDRSWWEKQNHMLRIQQEMPEYDTLEEEKQKLQDVRLELELTGNTAIQWKNEAGQILKRIETTRQEQEYLKDSGIRKVEIEQKQTIHNEQLERMKKLLERRGVWNRSIQNYKTEKEYLEKKLQSYQQASRHYDMLYDQFIASQAGLMARNLKNGEPCPVCGSVHHPAPYKMEQSEKMVDQKMVEDARAFREHEQNAVETSRETFTKVSDQLIAFKHQILQEGSHFLEDGESLLKANTFWTTISKMVRDKENVCAALNNQLTQCIKNVKVYEQNEKQLKIMEERMTQAKDVYQEMIQKKVLLQAEQTQQEKNIRRIGEKLSYSSKKDAEVIMKQLEDGMKQLKDQLSQAEKTLENNKKKLQSNQGQLEERKRQWKQMIEEVQAADRIFESHMKQMNFSLEMTLGELNHMKKLYHEQEKQAYGIRQSNQSIYYRLKETFTEYKDQQEHFAKVRKLSRIANGEMPGVAKIDFQTYMQRRYFKQMIQAANRRLAVMSRNQFLLECRDMNQLGKQGEVGLDLDVYSLVNDSVRDIKTLSGGESFMAALSMALGMADVIQQEAGKIHVDTLFIDEGFGTLDENSRNQAVHILNELAGGERLVGIISHVHELKAQIEQKIQVKKTEQGSQIVACYLE